MLTDRLAAATWAQDILKTSPLILDTETTGLEDGEICQIAVIDSEGKALLDTLVRPTRPIPIQATRIHGIENWMVAEARGFATISSLLSDMLHGRQVIVYNAQYDLKIIYRSQQLAGIRSEGWMTIARWHCAMEWYAQFYGDWNDYRGSYRWQKLTYACQNEGIPDPDAPAHSALGDCLRTLALVQKMAEAADQAVTP